MYRKIIVGYNDSDEASDALALGKLIAETTGGQLILTGVFPYGPAEPFASVAIRKAVEEAEVELAQKIERAAKDAGGEAEAFPSSSPARGLHDAIEELGADLVIVGSSSRADGGRVLAGNVALQLLHGSPCAVAVAPKGFRQGDHGLRVIAVGIDGSEESREAVRAAVQLGKPPQATIRLVAAVNANAADEFGWAYGQHNPAPTLREVAEKDLDEAAADVPDELRPARELIEGDVVQSLAEEAEQGADLLFVGSRGYGPVRRVLLGSVSGALVKAAPCPVLVVPRGVHVAGGRDDKAAVTQGAA